MWGTISSGITVAVNGMPLEPATLWTQLACLIDFGISRAQQHKKEHTGSTAKDGGNKRRYDITSTPTFAETKQLKIQNKKQQHVKHIFRARRAAVRAQPWLGLLLLLETISSCAPSNCFLIGFFLILHPHPMWLYFIQQWGYTYY